MPAATDEPDGQGKKDVVFFVMVQHETRSTRAHIVVPVFAFACAPTTTTKRD